MRMLPSKAEAAEDHAAADERTHVAKRSARTGLQGFTAATLILVVHELTGYELGPATAAVAFALLTWLVGTLQPLIENWSGRTLPGPFADGIHPRIGEKSDEDWDTPVDTSGWADGLPPRG